MSGEHEEQFRRYIDHGYDALATHPDYEQMDGAWESLAADTIASILHAVDEQSGASHADAAAGEDTGARELLDRAFRSYKGDFEELHT